ncbi:similar to Saccharomyces cerevisiae YJL162C JJJ2 Protein of unknown function, contains a J-domain, which is a region with homology to the E. coli DnaJ protein [Maudiozyma barnettii]|uniref:J domain-containing protein n=1 Tax=Maudiozyma barnettii TaxID=61262 RepID=A0A8H2VIL9_9SACH|nr:Jjj2p [Kazachstania barnettii]CAB4256065.1 similar to Saccharomyces cerevisiae YJL162C JJJ2 Protein of unknown function, contains a J-domain, which is a region with homology to the E. coli DnaJ protein [Kazachstania barnettii]CAD1784673.1 similar to Saccharomyces cerevisiae YJL162C JJJ2 Protein of unknown function, contains a J-domain, which is a region with homology to the E. coli DnaJ protein [Kazachstania barnettii]
MSKENEARILSLDETTWYSVLGLTTVATDVEIRRSYMKLAKILHPDKSKSDASAELFKVVVNAHNILTDAEKREEYDTLLRSQGLYQYNSPGKTSSFSTKEARNSRPRKAKSYDKQPYGFGFSNGKKDVGDNSSPKKSSVPIFQSFNMKNYQRSYNKRTEMDEERKEYTNNKFRDTHVEETEVANNEYDSKRNIDEDEEENEVENDMDIISTDDEHETGDRSMQDSVSESEGIQIFEAQNIHKRTKMEETVPHENPGDTNHTFWNHDIRRSARNKSKIRQQARRSTSPVKNTPLTNTDLHDTFTCGINEVINKMYNSMGKESSKSRSSSETTYEEPRASSKRGKPASTSTPEDRTDTDPIFNMEHINDTLRSIPMSKKVKLFAEYNGTSRTESIHEPVNQTLPRYYKKDSMSMQDTFNVNELNEMTIEIPQFIFPDMMQNITLYELEKIKQELTDFIQLCNEIKVKLIELYSNKVKHDISHNSRLFKVENQQFLQVGDTYNNIIINKIYQIEQAQHIAIEKYLRTNQRALP